MAVSSPPLALFESFPGLSEAIPHVPLADLPTPVQSCADLASTLNIGGLWIKRDDVSGEVYGGNKVRKLEFLLGQALRKGAKEVVTFGYAGSNHSTATAIFSSKVGLGCTSMLLPQANAHYVRRNLLASHGAGARLKLHGSVNAVAVATAAHIAGRKLRTGKAPVVIPAGGSSATGMLGIVNGVFELKRQIDAGELERPDRVYVPFGSMGTALGLSLGFRALGMETKVTAVRVADAHFVNMDKAAKLYRGTLALLRGTVETFPEVPFDESHFTVRDDFFGGHYAHFTEEGAAALVTAKEGAGLALEGTYTGKAFACLIADARKGLLKDERVLFWNTYNSRDYSAAFAVTDYHDLPRPFHRYFEEDVQPLDR